MVDDGFSFSDDLVSVVCVGAHADDIEIGAGGTIATIARANPEARFTFIVLTADDDRRREAITSASALLGERVELCVGEFEDGYLPYRDPGAVKDYLQAALPSDADLVFGPYHKDAHQDHRFAAYLIDEICREQPILSYEIAKYAGDLGNPSLYVPLDRESAESKSSHILAHFRSQASRPWFTEDALLGLMRIRGVEARTHHEYAEAFYSSKIIIGPST